MADPQALASALSAGAGGLTEKHHKVLGLARSPTGMHGDLYYKEARELQKMGHIEQREVISKSGGNRSYRWFAK